MIQKTNPIRRWKQWLALPLLGVLFVAVACEKATPPAEPAAVNASQAALIQQPPPPAVYTYVPQMAYLPGTNGSSNQPIVEFIKQHLAYPNMAASEQRTGQVFASFIVSDNGEVVVPKIVKSLGADYDEAVLAAIQQLPRFEPGQLKGKKVAVSFTVPIQFAAAPPPAGQPGTPASH